MVYVTGLFMSNLPFGISKTELIDDLVNKFPEEFLECKQSNKLKVTVYEEGNENGKRWQYATASGFEVDLDVLDDKSYDRCILNTNRRWRFKQDTGEERTADGILIKKFRPKEVRTRNFLQGKTIKKPLEIFKKKFLNTIGQDVFNGTNKIYVESGSITPDQLSQAGRLGQVYKQNSVMCMNYGSSFEALQAIMLLNSNNARFCDGRGNFSNASYQHGLGVYGEVLNIQKQFAEHGGYIPFSAFHVDIIDTTKLSEIPSYCWRCKTKFNLLGVDKSLNYVAGKCECSYNSQLDVLCKEKAYFWNNDKFTKLVLGTDDMKRPDNIKSEHWKILHQPLKQIYNSQIEYRRIVGPVLQDDWKFYSKQFKDCNTCDGILYAWELIEKIDDDKNPEDVFSFTIHVETNKFWNNTAATHIGSLTLTLNIKCKNEMLKREKRKATVVYLGEHENDKTKVIGKMKLSEGEQPVRGTNVHVVPKPNKTEYNHTKSIITKWAESPEKFKSLQCILDSKQITVFPLEYERTKMRVYGVNLTKYRTMFNSLNEEQKIAVTTAQAEPISIVQGPPGTGKTFTGSVIVGRLLLREAGAILATAASNYASDGIATRIARTFVNHRLTFSVLRIYSKKREAIMLQRNEIPDLGDNVTILHIAVRNSEMWLAEEDEEMLSIRQKLQTNNKDKLLRCEEKRLEAHITDLEREILSKHNVIVATTGTLADGRIQSWNSPRKISTVIVDEAGQLTQAQSISVLVFKQFRTVFIGDQQQLNAQVQSFSAKIAGLEFSAMDWFKRSNTTLPWTVLLQQHRMTPQNRIIVSELSYSGELKDAAVIKERSLQVILKPVQWLSKPTSPVIVMDHDFKERIIGTSYYNLKEIEICKLIGEHLLREGVQSKDIVVLTLYEAQRSEMVKQIPSEITVRNVDAF